MDDSPEQTKRVMKAIARQNGKGSNGNGLRAVQDVSQMLRPCTVDVPFAEKLVYASSNVLARRRFSQVLTLIEAHAALHQHQRPTHTDEEGRLVVEAQKADYAAIYPLLAHVVEHFEEELSPSAMRLLEIVEAKGAEQFTLRQAMKWTHWSYSRTFRTMRELRDLDLLRPDHMKMGTARVYEVAPYFRNGVGIRHMAPPKAV